MDDYIKRENAKRAVWGCARDTGIDEAPFEYAEGLLEDVPSEDVAPVRHGRWIECTSSPHWKCSMCGTKAPIWFDEFNEICEWLSVYCPNCGAKMDGEDDE